MRKIIINLLAFDKNLSGAGRYAIDLLSSLNNLNLNDEFIILLRSENIEIIDFEINNKIKIKRVKLPKYKSARVLYEQLVVPFYVLTKKIDIVYVPLPLTPILKLYTKCKYISTIHDLTPFFIPEKYTPFHRFYVKFTTRISAKFSDHIITVSEYSKFDIMQNLHIQMDKISVVYNSIRTEYSETRKFNKKDKSILFIGNIHPGKNLERTILAFKNFSEVNNEYRFIIAGKVAFKKSFYKHFKELINHPKIDYRGRIEEKEKIDLLKKAEILIFPSLYEGFGIPLLEGMKYECKIITSNVSSMPEVAGENAFYCDPYSIDSIVKSIKNATKAVISSNQHSSRNKQLAKFQPEREATRIVKIFNQILS